MRKVTAQLDVPTTPPDVLARLYAALLLQAAEVRCVDGPAPVGRTYATKRPCAAPRFATVGGKAVLQFAVEEYPHPALLNRDDHRLYWYQVEVLPHELSSMEGEGLAELEPAPALPASAPPLPTMAAPPTYLGTPAPAPADVDAALCKAAADTLSGMAGRACKAYRYPTLALPTGELFYLANDAGQRYLLAGGGTSWLDLTVYVIARLAGTEQAMRVARMYLIDWHALGQQPYAALARKGQVDDALVARAQVRIAQSYAVDAPVQAMAAEVGLAERSFKRRFARATGMSPLEYVHTMRLEEAKQLLETTAMPIEAIAAEVGYQDASFFGRLFRRRVELTPARYRKRFAAMRQALQPA